MKRFALFFIILLFIVFAYFGFKAAAKILPDLNGSVENSQISENSTTSLQQNYLLIHVNDMTQKKSELISVWIVFIYHSDPLQIMFLPLYPSTNEEVYEKLKQSFRMNSDGSLNNRFINQIKKFYDVDVSGYILTDNTGIGYSTLWLTGQEAHITSTTVITEEEKSLLLSNGSSSYQQFCQLVTIGSANSILSSVDWTLLLPDHFATNIPFESITLITDQIARSTISTNCSVFSNE